MITGRTRVVGVIGHPVGHSCSPAMHNAAFASLGMDYCYVPFDVAPAGLPAALEGMKSLGIVGLNVTIPHKPGVYALVDRLAPGALAVEAVNTLHWQDGVLTGHNTDGEGFARSLEAAGVPITGQRVVLVGAGGAARSVAAACAQRGAAEVTILNRTVSRAEELAARLQRWLAQSDTPATPAGTPAPEGEDKGQNVLIRVGELAAGELAVRRAEIVVQCTSVGMHPHQDAPSPVPAEWLGPGMAAYDLIYNPPETRFLAAARSAGAMPINGLGMLIHQGAAAFEIWTGVSPPLDVMENALLQALAEQPVVGGSSVRSEQPRGRT